MLQELRYLDPKQGKNFREAKSVFVISKRENQEKNLGVAKELIEIFIESKRKGKGQKEGGNDYNTMLYNITSKKKKK